MKGGSTLSHLIFPLFGILDIFYVLDTFAILNTFDIFVFMSDIFVIMSDIFDWFTVQHGKGGAGERGPS